MRVEDIELVVDEQLSEDPCFIVEVITTHGRLMVMGEIVVFSDHLIIEGMHVGERRTHPHRTWYRRQRVADSDNHEGARVHSVR